ncbi:Cytosolic endo-beta-N-acetylglucosaminidase [Pseudolycoriella hygida]|uniref:Cytosolic endo-beta-N-acetylglucosaminidase n=1 Tax=Pseudolycoriella hygida TaxID=35572 RepID=A0A9Q0RZM6_9DIPT|nr:Cytosolic endo-beta-N-acetylglucosaminidase [Pseudolycoriella hygida]
MHHFSNREYFPEYRFSYECRPLQSNYELLNFHRFPIVWKNLVVPLEPRCRARKFGDNFDNLNHKGEVVDISGGRAEVLVCHDLAGNYRDDRFIAGSRKWDDYRFYHWAGIDYFCYFSHQYITVPTLSWINAAHKNGVKVLGTIIVESSSGRARLDEILQSESYMHSIVESLVFVAKSCQFEGWLLNVECPLSENQIPMLKGFVDYLTVRMHQDVPNGMVFWYDSIIETGDLRWQNELNDNNKSFFDLCDGILINYAWTEKHLERTVNILNEQGGNIHKVFVGIDVFGRGQLAKFDSHITLSKIKKYDFSVGIFAPGWTFEATRGVNISEPTGNEICNSRFIERNDLFWQLLWKYLLTAGPTLLPFYTSFCLGSGKQQFRDGFVSYFRPWLNLSDQSWQPSVPSKSYSRFFNDSFNGGSCLSLLPTAEPTRLFAVDFACQNDIILAYSFKRSSQNDDVQLMLNLRSENSNYCQLFFGGEENVYKYLAPGQIWCRSLKYMDLKKAIIHLSTKEERMLPSITPINGWEVRYYYFRCEQGISAKITDIGILSQTTDDYDGILLGAIHIHEGVPLYRFADIQMVTNWDFVAD